MPAALPSTFFARPVLEVAPDLLGKTLMAPGGSGVVTEVEAYDGEQDMACHARFGRTPRTEIMYGPPGHWYVYLIYGMYWMLNIVTGDEGYPSAVLIRGAGPWNGPGKLTKNWFIDGSYNGKPATPSTQLWLDHAPPPSPDAIVRTPRIGVGYAGEWAEKPYRFLMQGT